MRGWPRSEVAIGLVAPGHDLRHLPGTVLHAVQERGGDPGRSTERGGLCYRGTDGLLFDGSEQGAAGKDFGPCFGKGDVVGCGVLVREQRVVFTLNGARVGEQASLAAAGSAPQAACTSEIGFGPSCPEQ